MPHPARLGVAQGWGDGFLSRAAGQPSAIPTIWIQSVHKVNRYVLLSGLLGLISGCATSQQPDGPPALFVLDQSTTRLEGWFSAGGGEWTLYPLAHIADYVRFDRKEDEKCVPLLNGTGAGRPAFSNLEGRKVIVEGHTIRYNDLPIGPSNHDDILYKRYFNDQLVMNYCYREIVFVTERIKLVPAE
jgi:hypothetical protein